MAVYRIYVEKKTEFNIDGKAVLEDLRTALRIEGVTDVRIINRYDAEEISEENFNRSIPTVFSEPPLTIPITSSPKQEKISAFSRWNSFPDSLTKERTAPPSAYKCCAVATARW